MPPFSSSLLRGQPIQQHVNNSPVSGLEMMTGGCLHKHQALLGDSGLGRDTCLVHADRADFKMKSMNAAVYGCKHRSTHTHTFTHTCVHTQTHTITSVADVSLESVAVGALSSLTAKGAREKVDVYQGWDERVNVCVPGL